MSAAARSSMRRSSARLAVSPCAPSRAASRAAPARASVAAVATSSISRRLRCRLPRTHGMTTEPHPYRVALENRDPGLLASALREDVVFDTPAFAEPIRGRESVLELFAALATVFEDPLVTDEL